MTREPDPWAIAPLGTLRGDAHYPTTAELAAFRRSIDHAGPPDHWTYAIDDQDPAHELRHGIGYRFRCVNCGSERCPEYGCATYNPDELAHRPDARREASALRSRAFARGLFAYGMADLFAPGTDPHSPAWHGMTFPELPE